MQITISKHALHAAHDAIVSGGASAADTQSAESIDTQLDAITDAEIEEARKEYQRQYYRDHREQMLEAQRKWRRKNRDKMREYQRRWYIKLALKQKAERLAMMNTPTTAAGQQED